MSYVDLWNCKQVDPNSQAAKGRIFIVILLLKNISLPSYTKLINNSMTLWKYDFFNYWSGMQSSFVLSCSEVKGNYLKRVSAAFEHLSYFACLCKEETVLAFFVFLEEKKIVKKPSSTSCQEKLELISLK